MYRLSDLSQLFLGYSYNYGLNDQERTTVQTYSVNSHSVFVGIALSPHFLTKNIKEKENTQKEMDLLLKSFAKLKSRVDSNEYKLENLFVDGTNINNLLQNEIIEHIHANTKDSLY